MSGLVTVTKERGYGDQGPRGLQNHEADASIHKGYPQKKEAAHQVQEVVESVVGLHPFLIDRKVGDQYEKSAHQRNKLKEHGSHTMVRGIFPFNLTPGRTIPKRF